MAINTNGLPQIAGPRTLVSGGPPIVLGNEVRGGIHRISGETGDTLSTIDARRLQAGMLVYDENTSQFFMYRNVGDAPDSPTDANDPYRGSDGRLPNNVGTIGADDSNWIEFRLSPEVLNDIGNVFINAPSNGQVLEYRSGQVDDQGDPLPDGWINSTDNVTSSLQGLTDVTYQGTPAIGQVLEITSVDPDGSNVQWGNREDNIVSAVAAIGDVNLTDIQPDDRIVYTLDRNGDGTNIAGWVNQGANPPQYPEDQLIIADPDNAGQFIPNVFLYELRVDTNTDGTRSVRWMETPGNVDFTIQDRPEVNEGETAFRRAPSQYVVSGFTGQDTDPAAQNLDVSAFTPDPGPLVWGSPVPRLTPALFSAQPLLYFFGNRASGEPWFLRESTESIEILTGRVVHVVIDYEGVITVSQDPSNPNNRNAEKDYSVSRY